MSLEPGQVLNHRYLIIRPLGSGGMGSVDLARGNPAAAEAAFARGDVQTSKRFIGD